MKVNTDSKKRIVFFDHAPFMGGAEIAVLRHIKYLNRSIFEPYLVTSIDSPEFVQQASSLLQNNVKFISFKRLKPVSVLSIIRLIKSVFESIRICKKIQPDLIVANVERAFYVSFITSVLLRVKLILYVRDFEFSHKLIKLTSWKVVQYLPVSKNIAEYYYLKDKTQVVYVGSDIQHKIKENENYIPIEYNGIKLDNNKDFIVGYLGRIVRDKGPFILLDGFSKFCQSNTIKQDRKVWLIYVGTGADYNELQQIISKSKYFEQIITVGFDVDIVKWYSTFNVFVHCSIYADAYATTLIEAAFIKVPIIATDTGGTCEFISNYDTGLLIKPTSDEITQALITLYNDSALAKRIAENAYQRAIKNNTEEIITSQLEQIYLNC